VLAAGLSTRLGRPKQLEVLEGETLVERTVRIAGEAGLTPLVAVLLDASLIAPVQAMGAIPMLNPRAWQGMASSIHVGVKAAAAAELDGLVLMTCDQIALTAKHLHALCGVPGEIIASRYAGRAGVPAYFPRASFEALLSLEGDKGARGLLREARAIPCEELALDVDTEEDLARAREYLARG
jgi:CTP:molybdopterin cytidylyltransferase MocA